jgi:UDP-N-acetylmuramate: L-alanyl-gamma-D-glutamyl-meso-diaminopimelate ligase
MRIHILGICGTFMAGIALLARELGHQVSGSDANAYPPMSEQLAAQGITVMPGYEPGHLEPSPECVVVGNALARGNPAVEAMLNRGMRYESGPSWLATHVLQDRWVLAVAGTHGKTSTSCMLAWILENAGRAPGFLVGGVPGNFDASTRLGRSPLFVVEADEYDTAFFDKRSKFVHYRPKTLIINNLEYDHADIFPDLSAVQRQFHHLVRTVPNNGLIIAPAQDKDVDEVLHMGCWTPVQTVASARANWSARLLDEDGGRFEVWHNGQCSGSVSWPLFGTHNVNNALAAIAAAHHAGVSVAQACGWLTDFRNAKRRLEVIAEIGEITVYDDFAHHPTAIAVTLEGLRTRIGDGRILVILEPRSNTMRLGVHRETLGEALAGADLVWVYWPPEVQWDLRAALAPVKDRSSLRHSVNEIIAETVATAHPGDHIVIMSNGAFEGIHPRLTHALEQRYA